MERLTLDEVSLMLTKIRMADFDGDAKRVERLRHLAYVCFIYHCSVWADPETANLAAKLLEVEQCGRSL